MTRLPQADATKAATPELEKIREKMIADSESLRERAVALIEACDRAPKSIDQEDHAAAEKVAAFVKQCQTHIRLCESTRKEVKQPFFHAGNMVDVYFTGLQRDIGLALNPVRDGLKLWQQIRAAAEKKRREAEAEEARQKAALVAAEEAEREEEARAKGDMEAAIKAREKAAAIEKAKQTAERLAAEKEAEMSKVGGAKLKTKWVCESWDRQSLDLEALREHFGESEINAAIRRFIAAGGTALRGAKIVKQTETVVR